MSLFAQVLGTSGPAASSISRACPPGSRRRPLTGRRPLVYSVRRFRLDHVTSSVTTAACHPRSVEHRATSPAARRSSTVMVRSTMAPRSIRCRRKTPGRQPELIGGVHH